MDAEALKDSHGNVRAWACGRCGAIETGPSHKLAALTREQIAERSLKAAANCCRCRRCHGVKPAGGGLSIYCDACLGAPSSAPE